MSILQEYEKIRKDIGEEKWRSIDTYINVHHPELRLDQIIYNSNNWIDFEKWFNKEIKVVNVNVLDVWKTDYDDYRADVEIGKGEINQGNVIASYDEDTIRNLTGNLNNPLSENELKNAIAVLVASAFEEYISLPKISKVSPLLKEVYDYVRESDATMCHITSEDWKEYYSEHYSEKDLDDLENEIKKYGLEEVVEVFGGEYITNDNKIIESDYRIIGYGDLETRFIDDRNLNLETSYESGFEIQ